MHSEGHKIVHWSCCKDLAVRSQGHWAVPSKEVRGHTMSKVDDNTEWETGNQQMALTGFCNAHNFYKHTNTIYLLFCPFFWALFTLNKSWLLHEEERQSQRTPSLASGFPDHPAPSLQYNARINLENCFFSFWIDCFKAFDLPCTVGAYWEPVACCTRQ